MSSQDSPAAQAIATPAGATGPARTPATQHQAPQEQESRFTLSYVLQMLLMGLVMRFFFNTLFNPTPTGTEFDLKTVIDISELPSQETTLRNGEPVLSGPAPFLINWLQEG